MAFRNSLLLIAFFVVATTSVANATQFATVVITASRASITPRDIMQPPLPEVMATLNCGDDPIGSPTRVRIGEAVALTFTQQSAAQINSRSCFVSADAMGKMVARTILFVVPKTKTDFGDMYDAPLVVKVFNGTIIFP